MAVDEKGGISRGQSMPWPKNSIDLKWFKENTLNNIVVMGRKTWEDPFMPTPLKSRINVLITNKNKYLIEMLDKSKSLSIAFGLDVIQSYIKLKNSEIKNFRNRNIFDKKRPVTQWEKDNTLDC